MTAPGESRVGRLTAVFEYLWPLECPCVLGREGRRALNYTGTGRTLLENGTRQSGLGSGRNKEVIILSIGEGRPPDPPDPPPPPPGRIWRVKWLIWMESLRVGAESAPPVAEREIPGGSRLSHTFKTRLDWRDLIGVQSLGAGSMDRLLL